MTDPTTGTSLAGAYLRVYSDAAGHSRLEEVTLNGDTRGVSESALRAIFSSPIDANSIVFRYVVQEAEDDEPHTAPRRQFIVMLSGQCEIEACHGERRRMQPGDIVLLEDVHGHGHITRRVGADDRSTLVILLPPESHQGCEIPSC